MDLSPPLRLARSAVFAAVCVLLTCFGHVLAGGEPVGVAPPAAAFAGVLAVAHLLAGHERSLVTILAGLVGGQFALHALLASGGSHHVLQHPVAPGEGGAGMTLGHLGAALAAAWWLRRGERSCWDLARRLASALVRPRLLIPEPVTAAPVAKPADRPGLRPGAALLRYVRVLRGPPPRRRTALAR